MNNIRKGFRSEKAQMIYLPGGGRAQLAQVRTLAVTAHKAKAFKEAESYYRAILRALPADPWTLNYLGLTFHAQGQQDQAKEVLEKAVRASPQHIEAWINLANVELALGNLDACERVLKAALEKNAGATQLTIKLANLLSTKGNALEALALLTSTAFHRPDDTALLQAWGAAFIQAVPLPHDARIDALICHVLSLPSTWASSYARPVYRYLNKHPVIMDWMARQLSPEAGLSGFYEDAATALSVIQPLIRMMALSSAIDVDHEAFFTSLRRQQLEEVSNPSPNAAALHPFSIALAQFCFNNDYVFFETAEEKAQLASLKAAIENSVAPGEIDWRRVVCFCSYRPLTDLSVAERIAQPPHHEALQDLVNQQFAEPAAEGKIKPTVAKLRPIEDRVSQKVQGMYESSPYPRWTKPCVVNPVASFAQALAIDGLSGLSQDRPIDAQTRILVAGCGTGQHSMLTGGRYRPAQVTAVDLSLPSLAYAVRKSRECGLTNIDFFQGDLLDVGHLSQQFDLIESQGVLHHMEDPMRGWKALVDVLRPGGLMKIGLYSRRARKTIFDLRDRYAQEGIIPGADEVRAIRRDIIARANSGDANMQLFLTIRDFFSLNETIDLLFHLQESVYSPVEIAAMIETLGLRFIGMCLPQNNFRTIFLAEHGADADLTSLRQWDAFEQRHPNAFIGMLTFWVMKPAGDETLPV